MQKVFLLFTFVVFYVVAGAVIGTLIKDHYYQQAFLMGFSGAFGYGVRSILNMPDSYKMTDFDWEYIVEGHYRRPGFALIETVRGEWNLYYCIPDQTMDHLHFYAEPMSLDLLKRIDETTKVLKVYSTVLK